MYEYYCKTCKHVSQTLVLKKRDESIKCSKCGSHTLNVSALPSLYEFGRNKPFPEPADKGVK